MVSISDNVPAARAEANDVFGPLDLSAPAEAIEGMCSVGKDGQFGLFLHSNCLGPDTVAHELFHLTIGIADMYGIKVDPHNHEAVAYLHGWLAAEIEKVIATFKRHRSTTQAQAFEEHSHGTQQEEQEEQEAT